MRTAAAIASIFRAVGRQLFLGALAVATAVLGLALLAAALTTGGSAIGMPEFVSGASEPDDAGPRIVAAGYGRATAPAERATIQFLIGQTYGMVPGDTGPSDEPGTRLETVLAPVTGAIERAGVEADAIRIVASPIMQNGNECYGPVCNTTRLDVVVDQPTGESVAQVIRAAAAAAQEENIAIHDVGVAYEVGDCAPLQRQARERATQDARVQAQQQAEVLGLKLGAMREAGDAPVDIAGSGVAGGGCNAENARIVSSPYNPYGMGMSGVMITVPGYDPTLPAEASAVARVNLTYEVDTP